METLPGAASKQWPKPAHSTERSARWVLGVPEYCRVLASNFDIHGSHCHKDFNLLCWVFWVSAGFVFKTLACLPNAGTLHRITLSSDARATPSDSLSFSLLPLIWLFSSSLSLSPAFLPSSHSGRCCSLRLPTGILISAPRQRSVPPCSLRPQSPVFPQEHSYPPVTDLQFFLLHAWFSHPGSLQRKHWQEKSAKVRTNRSFFLLCIFGNRLFRKVTYACQGKCAESLPTWSQLPSFSRQSCGSEYASRSLSSGSAAITWESDFILPCSKSWAPVTMGKKPRRWPSWTQAPRQPPKARRTEAPLQTRGSEGAGR